MFPVLPKTTPSFQSCSGSHTLVQNESIFEFSVNKINVTKIMKFVLGRIENMLVKGENAGYRHVFKSFIPLVLLFWEG